jgi:hypothetical protein
VVTHADAPPVLTADGVGTAPVGRGLGGGLVADGCDEDAEEQATTTNAAQTLPVTIPSRFQSPRRRGRVR